MHYRHATPCLSPVLTIGTGQLSESCQVRTCRGRSQPLPGL